MSLGEFIKRNLLNYRSVDVVSPVRRNLHITVVMVVLVLRRVKEMYVNVQVVIIHIIFNIVILTVVFKIVCVSL